MRNLLAALFYVGALINSKYVNAINIDVAVSGTVVSAACNVSDSNLVVDFKTLYSRELHANLVSNVIPFQVRLENCDVSLMDKARVAIGGRGDNKNPALLSLDDSSSAAGVAIGFKQGRELIKPMALNSSSEYQALSPGDSILHFGAYIEKLGEITPGEFKATAVFSVEYD